MPVGRQWAVRNLGYDPLASPLPVGLPTARGHSMLTDLQREIIDFDSESAAGRALPASSSSTGMSGYTELKWPRGLAPLTRATIAARAGATLPKTDVLVVTWTVDEGHALSRVLTPGKDTRDDYISYTHRFATLKRQLRKGCPALEAGRIGAYWLCTIGAARVLIFKSDSHMSQDGPQLPIREIWRQIISEAQPKLVLTTGTAGGIGRAAQVGDVVVSPLVRFDCLEKFKAEPFRQAHFASRAPTTAHFAAARVLFKANAGRLPKDNTRPPRIRRVRASDLPSAVLTTDFFGFDTSEDHYKLQGLGSVSEMGDAVLGLACADLGSRAPRWLSVRNVSDPQIAAAGMTLPQQARLAAQIYKGFGRWSSVCSAIVCWALIVAESSADSSP